MWSSPLYHGWYSFLQMCGPTFLTFSQNSEINLTEIGRYIDYLSKKQGVNSIFGKFTSGFVLWFLVVLCFHLNQSTHRNSSCFVSLLTTLIISDFKKKLQFWNRLLWEIVSLGWWHIEIPTLSCSVMDCRLHDIEQFYMSVLNDLLSKLTKP